jgi:ABC transport system ATP-binding/permease protein
MCGRPEAAGQVGLWASPMTGPFAWPDAGPTLVVEFQGTEKRLRPGVSYQVGRDPQSDFVTGDSRVSWNHAVLRTERGAWLAEDCGSTNGTFVASRKIDRFDITDDCVLHFGTPDDGPAMSCSLLYPEPPDWPSVDRRPSAVMRAPARALRIGRADDNDIVLDDLSVSRHHAELRNAGDGHYLIVDLDSHNGTFLNGARVIFTSPVTELDIIGIGPATFRLVGGELRQFIDSGDVSLIAQDLTVRLGDRVLLDRVSFPIGERSLVAVIGPSGAGKTTLLRALTGMAPATEGAVLYDNRDLYSHYAELRHRIGLVPQEDVIYPHLTPRRALGYAAELRFPGDTSDEERSARVQEVLGELKLNQTTKDRPEPAADTPAASLSGGEKKRVNIALELLTKPSVLFLDEPTSSLDVELKEDVVDGMRELAQDGRTVIMVTHDLEYLDKCDRVLLLKPGGQMAFYGPSDEGLRYFGKARWVEVYRALRTEPERDWAGEFQQSSCYQQYVASGLTGGVPDAARGPSEPPPAPRSRLAQLAILCRRYSALIAADRGFLISLAIAPIVFGALVRLLAGRLGLVRHPNIPNINAETTLLFLALIAVLGGAAGSVRELIKERAMYIRERTAGLSAGAYLLSKMVVLGLITGLQAAVLVLIGVTGVPLPRHGAYLPSPLAEILLAIVVLAIASMTLGLAVSAFVDSSEKTMQALVLIAIVQVMLSGGVLALGVGLKQLAYVAPARWGFGATASTVDLNGLLKGSGKTPDPLWDPRPSVWLFVMGMQILLIVVFALVAWWRLLRIGPGSRARPLIGFRARRRSKRRPPASPQGQDAGVSRPPLARTPP